MILGEYWLRQHKAQIKFNLAVLTINDVETPLGSASDQPVLVVINTDIKLPPRTTVSSRGRIVYNLQKVYGEDHHRLIIEQQHKLFTQARRRIKRIQNKKIESVSIGRKEVELGFGDGGKLDQRRELYYKIVAQTGSGSFVMLD